MNFRIKDIFYKPINNDDLFWLIKSNASIKNFIEAFEYKSNIEEQISIVNQLIKILSNKKALINICIINKFNEIKMQIDNNLILDKSSTKALPVYQNKDKTTFVDWLIKQYFLYKSEKYSKGILNLLLIVINIVGIQKNNINFIYEKISDYFVYSPKKYFIDDDKININNDLNNLTRYLNLLLLMYGHNNKVTKPYNFYYFGNDAYLKIEPPVNQSNAISLKGGLSIFSCFNCLLNPKFFNNKYSIIFSIEFNNKIYLYLLIDREMNLIISINNENLNIINNIEIPNKIILKKIEYNKWYNIIISLNMKKYKKFLVNIVINSDNYESIEIENNNSIEIIENIFLFKNFIGLTTSFLLYNSYLDINNNNFFNSFQYGLYKISHINKYINNQLNTNYLQNLIVLIIPSQIKSNEIYNFANFINMNINDDTALLNNNIKIKISINFNKYNSNETLYLSGVNINLRLNKNILLLGNINNLLPLFEILLGINKKIFDSKKFIYLNVFQKCLLCLLKIIEVIISNNKNTKIRKIINCKFFKVLSLFLEKIIFSNEIEVTIFNDKLIAILKNIGDLLLLNDDYIKKKKICNIFFNKILLNINIIKKFNISQIINIHDYLYKCIINNTNSLKIDYKNLIFLIKYCDNMYGMNYCCKEHFLYIKEITKIENNLNYNKMLNSLLDINTKLLSEIIKDDYEAYIDLLNLLIGKNSPCLVELVLKNIFYQNLKLKNKDINDNKKILINLFKNNFLYILLYLLSLYVYPNIIKQIIDLFSIITYLSNSYNINYNNFFNNINIINYIGNSIYPIYLKLKSDYNINISKHINFKANHFFSTSILPFVDFEEESLNYTFSNIKKCNTYDKFQIKNTKLDNDPQENIKINKSSEKFERKRKGTISNTIKYNKSSTLKPKITFNEMKNKNQRQGINLSFERMNDKTSTIKENFQINIINLKFNNNYKSIDEPNNKLFLLNKLENDRKFIFKRIILDSLINWINKNPFKYTFEVIIKFIKNIEYEYIHLDKFVDSFNQMFSIDNIKQMNYLNDLIDLKTFNWFFDITYQFYLLKHKFNIFSKIPYAEDKYDLINNIVINGRKAISNIFVYNIFNNKYKNIIEEIDYIMFLRKKIKKRYPDENGLNNLLNIFYKKILSDLLNVCQKHLFYNNKSHDDYNFKFSEEKENIFIYIINICYEFVFFSNIEDNYLEINNFLKSKNRHIFNNILLTDIHIVSKFENNNENNNTINNNNNVKDEEIMSVKQYFSDFYIFEKIVLIIKPFISLNNFGNYEDEKYLNDNILNNKKSNKYYSILKLLCYDNVNSSEYSIKIIPLIYILSNLFIFSLNLSKNKKEIKLMLDNYKSFIIFLILSSSNLTYSEEDIETNRIITIINKKVIITINYYIYYMYDKYKNNNEIIENYLIVVFKLMIKLMNNIYIQMRKKNSFFSIISNEKIKSNKISFKCALHEVFLSEVMIKTFNKEYISSLVKNKFKEFNNTKLFIEICGKICIDFDLRYELKNIFNIDNILNRYQNNQNIFDMNMNIFKDNDGYERIKEKINEKIKESIRYLLEINNKYQEKLYIKKLNYKNDYKKIKKKLFGYNGFWHNITILNNNEKLLKFKLINHHSKVLFRNILLPILDFDNYISQYQIFNKKTFLKQNVKNIINLDSKKIFVDIIKESEQKNNFNGNNSTEFCLTEEIRNNIFPELVYYINRINSSILDFNINKFNGKSYLVDSSYICCYIKPDTHIRGYLFLKEKKIKFIMDIYNNSRIQDEDDDEFDNERGCCYGCLIKYKNNKFFSFSIKYSSIKYIFLRKYYYKDSSLEIYTSKNKSYYINFCNPKIRQYIVDIILIHFHSKQEIKVKDNKLIGYYLNNDINNIYIFDNNYNYNDNICNINVIIKKWINWEVTSFELLNWLNIYSNRSFNDLTQYPVFPWILTEYNDFISSSDKNEKNVKEAKNEDTNNNSEINDNKNITINLMNNLNENHISNMNGTTIKSSSEMNSKYISNTYIEKRIMNKLLGNNIIKYIRDFSIPMGMMTLNEEGEKRKKKYLEKYISKKTKYKDNLETFQNENYIYSSHYSNPKYISGYLARIFPFVNINTELYRRDMNNNSQLLISIDKSFKEASSKMDDIKELCPEFFYLPEMFININYLDLKIENNNNDEKDNQKLVDNYYFSKEKDEFYMPDINDSIKEKRSKKRRDIFELNYNNNIQTKKNLLKDFNLINNYDNNDVLMPKWANNNPYIFVSKMRSFLELEEVGKNINKWFDLIFGNKQKDNNLNNCNNLFLPCTYESFDIRKIKNDKSKKNKSFYYKLVEKGQTPHQILNIPFPQRKLYVQNDFSKSLIKNCLKYNSFKNKKKNNLSGKRKVLKIKFINNENIICIFNYYQYAFFEILKYALIIDIKIDYIFKYYLTKEIICKYNYSLIKDFQITSLNQPIIIYSKGRIIAQGGFYGGLILLSEIDLENEDKTKNPFSSIVNITEIFNKIDYSPIVSLIINDNEDIIFSGTYMGSIIIYDINWNIKYILNDHQNLPITSIDFNDDLNIWGSSCMDGYIKLYTYPTNKAILSMKLDQSSLYADYLLIISSPLPSFVIYSRKNLFFYSYSLLGKVIEKDKEDYIDIKSPIIFKDSYGNDKLIYGDDMGSINIRALPTLDLMPPFEINESAVNIIGMSENSSYCAGWSDDEEEIYIIFEPKLIE